MPVRKDADGTVRIRAPKRLGVLQDRAAATIRFIKDLRREAAANKAGRIVVEFTNCSHISRAACLLITAELKRAVHVFDGDAIDVMTPKDPGLANLFHTFGLYKYFNVPSPTRAKDQRASRGNAIIVRSGGLDREEEIEKLAEIAQVANKVCKQASTATMVDEALQEAMFNAGEHAYAGASAKALPKDRWWFAGLFDPVKGQAFFYALDHGMGIPARSAVTMAAEIEAYWNSAERAMSGSSNDLQDDHRLEAAIRATRLDLEGREGRGQGLPTMAGLIDDTLTGEMRILSGGAAWHSRRLKNAASTGANTRDRCYRLREEFPGTLVCWRITGSNHVYSKAAP